MSVKTKILKVLDVRYLVGLFVFLMPLWFGVGSAEAAKAITITDITDPTNFDALSPSSDNQINNFQANTSGGPPTDNAVLTSITVTTANTSALSEVLIKSSDGLTTYGTQTSPTVDDWIVTLTTTITNPSNLALRVDVDVKSGVSSGTQVTAVVSGSIAGVTITETGGSTDVTEGGATDTYTVVLDTQPTADVGITLSPDAEVSVGAILLTFTNGDWDTAQTVTVTAVDEGAHTGTITHTAASADTDYDNLPGISDVTANVTDNDAADFAYTSGDDGTNPGGGDYIAGVSRSGGGNDSNNLVSGKPRVDVEYVFSIEFNDDTGPAPNPPVLYLAHKSSPTEGAGGDFFKYILTCTGGNEGTCSTTLKLGPAAAHKFYFVATKFDTTEVRLPASGYNDGPTVQVLTNYEMVSAARDIDSQNLGGTEAFNSTYTYRWASLGTDTVFNTTFNGNWELVTPGSPAKAGEGYFVLKNSSTLPELASSSDVTAATYTYTLQRGWNIISNPYNGNVMLSDIQVEQDDGTPDTVDWTTATGNGWIINGIYFYDGSDWEDTYTLESAGGSPDAELVPWLSYWVYVNDNDVLKTYKLIITKPAQ
jgi:hypothetical protein